ncbi:2-keto-3-deoxygluconate permease [Curtanaerobium respiraculi]|uniref:2-keto-3-deoxygluconate permease n=1 Tax=Curtanaerobium respiraculi TaxID=2949669 RepID=UPI0024B3904A|nr:2-keto-3-deoxygluconate permease [Curtanaerobium respiraculi]
MIMRFIKRVPAGMMVVPLLLGCLINTFFPQALQIGGITTATFSSAGSSCILGILLFCMGTNLQVKEMPAVLKRGGILLVSKFAIGAILGILVGTIFGPAGVLGLTPLAIICAVTNSNGSIYFAICQEYGDDKDQAAFALLALNDGPFLTMVALGFSGLANIPFMNLVAALIPIALGMLVGNLDHECQKLFGPLGNAVIPFVGFALGAGINLQSVIAGGLSGVLLAFVVIFVGGLFILFFDRIVGKRPGYAAWAVATTAGNAVAVPAAVASADVALEGVATIATVQVAACTVVTAIVVPLLASWWAKRYGCLRIPQGTHGVDKMYLGHPYNPEAEVAAELIAEAEEEKAEEEAAAVAAASVEKGPGKD